MFSRVWLLPVFPGFTSWICLALWTLFAPHLDYCCLPGLSLFALPLLDIVRRSSTHACPKDNSVSCPCHTCLLFIDPACIMTMFWNKALHMDPHVSCLVDPVTEYSAPQGSSNFSDQHFSGMDTTRLLFALKQGPRSLENHIREFLAFAHYSDLPDIILIEIFCDGINQPLRSQLRREGPRSLLSCFFGFCFVDCWLTIHCGCRGWGSRHRIYDWNGGRTRAGSQNGGHNNTPACHCCQSWVNSSQGWC